MKKITTPLALLTCLSLATASLAHAQSNAAWDENSKKVEQEASHHRAALEKAKREVKDIEARRAAEAASKSDAPKKDTPQPEKK